MSPENNSSRTPGYNAANDQVTNMTEQEKVHKQLEQEGYTDQFRVEKDKLVNLTTNKKYKAKDVKVSNFYRFEGVSNPDDMSILYAIETTDGSKGTLTDAYGLYSDDDTGTFMQDVEMNKKTHM
ncbi:MAG: hypothetical protein ACM3VS_07280 [Candidatus Dadabacteria bacterium]